MKKQQALHLDYSDDLEADSLSVAGALQSLEEDILRRIGYGSASDVRLLLAIMQQSAIDRDEEYFLGHKFKYHCYLLGLDSEDLLEMIIEKGLNKKKVIRKTRYEGVDNFAIHDEIRNNYSKGACSQADLAREYNLSALSISKIVHGMQNKGRLNKSATLTEDVITERLKGTTIKRIARKFHVGDARVVAILKPLGMTSKLETKNKYHLGG